MDDDDDEITDEVPTYASSHYLANDESSTESNFQQNVSHFNILLIFKILLFYTLE